MSGNGTIGFPMYKNIVIDTKIKAQACSKPKVQIWPFELILSGQMATNGHFGHSDQSEVSGNGIIGFPMHKNIVMDTKIKALACSEPKLQIWPFKLILSSQNGHKWLFWPLGSI